MTLHAYIAHIESLIQAEVAKDSDSIEEIRRLFYSLLAEIGYSGELVGVVEAEAGSIQTYVQGLGLTFVPIKDSSEANLCYADAAGLRDEFRSTCSAVDLLDCMYGLFERDSGLGPPADVHEFWELVKRGGAMRAELGIGG